MIKNEQLIQYFWENANVVTSNAGVDIDLHGDSFVEVSVLIRNHEEYGERIQLTASFHSLQNFVEFFKLECLEDMKLIGLEDMFVLYKAGRAELRVTEF
ncbi:hypothetical protein [Pedobacter nutrimenti]|uniref:hypothetical protein n=1 Tax=Pedobacter nutrimenti TaxID=1241337 RepID=UPI002930A575|nr:hypothetical protein [Pedobacter nutrimenti]